MKVEIDRVTRGRDDALNFRVVRPGDPRHYIRAYAAPRGYKHHPCTIEFLRYRGLRFFLVGGCAAPEAWLQEFTQAFKAAVAEWLLMQTAAEFEKKLEILESEK